MDCPPGGRRLVRPGPHRPCGGAPLEPGAPAAPRRGHPPILQGGGGDRPMAHHGVRLSGRGTDLGHPPGLVPGDQSGGRGPVRSKVIQLSSGRLLAPNSTELGPWTAYADRSDDSGLTWTRSTPVLIQGLRSDGTRTVQQSDVAVSEQSFHGRGVIQPTRGSPPLARSTCCSAPRRAAYTAAIPRTAACPGVLPMTPVSPITTAASTWTASPTDGWCWPVTR